MALADQIKTPTNYYPSGYDYSSGGGMSGLLEDRDAKLAGMDAIAPTNTLPNFFQNMYNQVVGGSNIYGQEYSAGANQMIGMGNAQDYYEAFYGPQQMLNEVERNRLSSSMGYAYADQALSAKQLQSQYGAGKAGIGVDQAAIGRKTEYIDHLQSLANQLLGVNKTDVTQQADMQSRQAKSSATSRGAWNAPGLGRSLTDIGNNLTNQLGRLDIGHEKETAGYNEAKAALQDQAAHLGISASQLRSNLELGLQRINLDTMMTVDDLASKLQSSNIQDMMLAQEIYNAALMGSDYFAQFPSGYFSGTPGTSSPPASTTTPVRYT